LREDFQTHRQNQIVRLPFAAEFQPVYCLAALMGGEFTQDGGRKGDGATAAFCFRRVKAPFLLMADECAPYLYGISTKSTTRHCRARRIAEAETGVSRAVLNLRAEAADDARENTLRFLSEEAGSESTRVLGSTTFSVTALV